MRLHYSLIIILCSFLMHTLSAKDNNYIFRFGASALRSKYLIVQELAYLSYPFLGFIADVWLTRYHSLRCSVVLMLASNVMSLVGSTIEIIQSDKILKVSSFAVVSVTLWALINIICIGLFDANIIQFGLDQLFNEPTDVLISFIRWFYWSTTFGLLIGFYIMAVSLVILSEEDCNYEMLPEVSFSLMSLILMFNISSTVFLFCCKKHFNNQRVGINPFRNMYRVLKYSWQHKVPERRSAFTYWEEDIPPRIDLGKNKYGGPFTNEQVEDVKTFFSILPLILSLFGFHCAGDGFSAAEQLQKFTCPSLPVLVLVVINPCHISNLVTVLGIPIYCILVKRLCPCFKRILMLTRIWMGLFLSLVQVVMNIIIVMNHNLPNLHQYNLSSVDISISPQLGCFDRRVGFMSNGTCFIPELPNDYYFLILIVPQLINGLSYLLVSMTMLEFICAQTPRTTQGLLIGLWYSSFSIRDIFLGLVNLCTAGKNYWFILEGAKGIMVLLSQLLLWYLSGRYRYRQRTEVVNVQAMIEDTHERWLDQEEQFLQEQEIYHKRVYGSIDMESL